MEKPEEIQIQKTGLKAGILICLSLIAFFLLMKYLNLIQYAELRALNFFILVGGLTLMYRHHRNTTGTNVDYLPGLLMGVFTCVVAVVPFSIFVYAWFSGIDPELLQVIKKNSPLLGHALNPLTAATTIIVEGISSGLIMSFTLMQYYKSGYINKHVKE